MSNSLNYLRNNFAHNLRDHTMRQHFAAAKKAFKPAAAFVATHKVGLLSYAAGASLAVLFPGTTVSGAALTIGSFMHPLLEGRSAFQSPEKFADSMTSGASDVFGVSMLGLLAVGMAGVLVLGAGCIETGISPEVHIGHNVTVNNESGVHGNVSLENVVVDRDCLIQTRDGTGHIYVDNSSVGPSSWIQASGEIHLNNATLGHDVNVFTEGDLTIEDAMINENVDVHGNLTIKGAVISGQPDLFLSTGKTTMVFPRGVDIDANGVIENALIKVSPGQDEIYISDNVHILNANITSGSHVHGPNAVVDNATLIESTVDRGEHLVNATRTPRPLFSFGK